MTRVLTKEMLTNYISQLKVELDMKNQSRDETKQKLDRAERLLDVLSDSRTSDAALVGFEVGSTISGNPAGNIKL